MKCHELMTQYEKENNFKFDVVIRCRLDSSVAMPLNVSDYFSKINFNLLNLYGKSIYKRGMGNNKLCSYYRNVLKMQKTEDPLMNDKDILKEINTDRAIYTFYTNMIWVFNRELSDIVCNIIYKYGCWQPESSETQFVNYLKLHKIDHIHIYTDTDKKYISARIKDTKDLAFNEPDLFLIRLRENYWEATNQMTLSERTRWINEGGPKLSGYKW